jgi:hypothetical protein
MACSLLLLFVDYYFQYLQGGNMLFTYRVDCWVPPKSGFDLAEQNHFMREFKKAIKTLLSKNKPFQSALENFGKNHAGMVLESVIIESDKMYEDNEEEIISEIKKKYRGAIIISHCILKLTKTKTCTV